MLGDRLAGGARSPADSCSKIFGRAASRPELTSSGELKRFSQNMSQADSRSALRSFCPWLRPSGSSSGYVIGYTLHRVTMTRLESGAACLPFYTIADGGQTNKVCLSYLDGSGRSRCRTVGKLQGKGGIVTYLTPSYPVSRTCC